MHCWVAWHCLHVDNDYMELDKGHNELALSTSNTEVVLNEQAHGDDALELSWTTGTNYGTGHKISYTLELAKAGSNFAAPCGFGERRAGIYLEEERGGIE